MTSLPSDILYEILSQSNLETIQNLCSSNKQFASLCQTKRVQQLIQEKIKNATDNLIQILLLVLNDRSGVTIKSPTGIRLFSIVPSFHIYHIKQNGQRVAVSQQNFIDSLRSDILNNFIISFRMTLPDSLDNDVSTSFLFRKKLLDSIINVPGVEIREEPSNLGYLGWRDLQVTIDPKSFILNY